MVNLDTLVSTGQPPWRPVSAARDVDVWDKYDFPLHGTYRLDDDVIVFTLITTAGTRSLWAYVPVPRSEQGTVAGARFDTEEEFYAFLEGCFAGREAVFAVAENFVIVSKSDGIQVPRGTDALLAAGARWYAQRAASVASERVQQIAKAARRLAETDDPDSLLRATQGALADLPV